jgi:hypothetical protein
MKLTKKEMDLAKIKDEDRDFCAHLIVKTHTTYKI